MSADTVEGRVGGAKERGRANFEVHEYSEGWILEVKWMTVPRR